MFYEALKISQNSHTRHLNSDFTHLIQFKMVLSSSLAMLWMELLVVVDCLCLDKFISYSNFQFLHEVWKEELLKLLICIFFWLCTSGTLIWTTFAIYVHFGGLVIFLDLQTLHGLLLLANLCYCAADNQHGSADLYGTVV